ncbi:MAG TPA: DUF6515 family protein [Steroidobacteraceae bacterium]|nr:DUF6515 family protein [Steroidobacteraceae bacterium]
MHRSTHKMLTVVFVLLLAVVASEALADGSRGHGPRGYGYGNPGYNRYSYSHHGSYSNYRYNYPARGYATYALPRGYHTAHYRGSPYYYHGGSWYRPYGPRYVVVAPPFGIGIGVLPPFYTTLWYGGSPYYYADNTYYSYRPERREYVVTEPPRGEPEGGSEPATGEVFVYPKNGQGEEQQANDRYECHRWAVERTGFDPTRPAGNVAETDMTSKRADYRRAEGACLEARGYSVK